MSAELLPAIYAALKAESDLTPTGIARRIGRSRHTVRLILLELEAEGHVISLVGVKRPDDAGRPCRYRLTPISEETHVTR